MHLGPQNLNVGPPFSPVGRTVYYFTISLFHFHWVPGRRFLHLGPQNLNVGPPFSPVGRTVYYFSISLFQFPLGSRQEVFASRAAKPECRTSPEVFLHLGQPFLHVGSRCCMLAKRIPLDPYQESSQSLDSCMGLVCKALEQRACHCHQNPAHRRAPVFNICSPRQSWLHELFNRPANLHGSSCPVQPLAAVRLPCAERRHHRYCRGRALIRKSMSVNFTLLLEASSVHACFVAWRPSSVAATMSAPTAPSALNFSCVLQELAAWWAWKLWHHRTQHSIAASLASRRRNEEAWHLPPTHLDGLGPCAQCDLYRSAPSLSRSNPEFAKLQNGSSGFGFGMRRRN